MSLMQESAGTPCPSKPLDADRIDIDPDGDLLIKVGKAQSLRAALGNRNPRGCVFKVCSKAMSRASPVWKMMLHGDFAEANRPQDKDWVVEMLDDDVHAMEIALNVIHGRFGEVPPSEEIFALDTFYRLTVLTGKYNMANILRIWALPYLEHDSTVPKKRKYEIFADESLIGSQANLEWEKKMWIAWEIGDQQLFVQAARHLVLNSIPDEGGAQDLFIHTLEPSGIVVQV